MRRKKKSDRNWDRQGKTETNRDKWRGIKKNWIERQTIVVKIRKRKEMKNGDIESA